MAIEIINGETWEVFEKFHKRNITNTALSIQKGGNIHLNTALYEDLGSPTHVALSYNRERRMMAIESRDAGQTPNTRVHKTNHIIAGHAFTRYYDIDVSKTRQYKATIQDKTIIVDLNEEQVS